MMRVFGSAKKTGPLVKRHFTKRMVFAELEAFVEELTDTSGNYCTPEEFLKMTAHLEPEWRAWRPACHQQGRVLGAVLAICLAARREGEEGWLAAVDCQRSALPENEWRRAVLPRLRALGVAVPEGRPRRLDLQTAWGPGYWGGAETACQATLAADRRALGRAADAEVGVTPGQTERQREAASRREKETARREKRLPKKEQERRQRARERARERRAANPPTECKVALRWAAANQRALDQANRAAAQRGRDGGDLDRAAERIFAIVNH